MSTELERRDPNGAAVLNYETGEVVELATAPNEDVAHVLFSIRQREEALKDLKKLVGDELNKRLDSNASWTEHMGAFQVKGSSPAPSREADVEPLLRTLEDLVSSGHVMSSAAEKAMERVVTYKVKWGGLDALRKLGGEVKQEIDKHIREVEKKRYAPRVELMRPELPK